MSFPYDPPKEVPPDTQLPEWEPQNNDHARNHRRNARSMSINNFFNRSKPPAKWLDSLMPSNSKHCGLRRKTFLIILISGILAVIVLVIGLSVGLSRRNYSSLFLPLPSDRQDFTGDLTYYGTGLGACGVTSTDADNIVSISHFLFDSQQTGSDPNLNPLCGLQIRAERFDEQVNAMRSVDVTVVDRCTGCAPTDLDVSPGVFSQLADPAKGRVTVTWAWLSPVPTTASR